MNQTLGKWISNQTAKPFYARKVFECKKGIKEAKAFVTGLGQFVFCLNGNKVDKHELTPGWTNYKKKIQYEVFNIKPYLQSGSNVAGIEVGNGWWHADQERYFFEMPPRQPEFAFLPPNPNPYKPYGKYLVANARIEILYEDGQCETIITDETWKTEKSAVILSNVFGSEIYDARLYPQGWMEASYDDSSWRAAVVLTKEEAPQGNLEAAIQPPTIIKKIYNGQMIRKVGDDAYIYDLGQNMAGFFGITVQGKAGSEIEIHPAEKLDQYGNIDQKAHNWTMVDSYTTYIIGNDNVIESYRPYLCHQAGRYLLIKGVTTNKKDHSLPYLSAVTGYYITSDSPDIGSFTCDDKRYEQIYDLVLKAVESNLHSVHTDCPTIERIAWHEPNHLMGPSIMFMKDVRLLWKKIIDDLRIDQHQEGESANGLNGERYYFPKGLVPSQAPCYSPNVLPTPLGDFYDTIAWGSAIVLAPYWHYKFYGDLRIIEENYEAGKAYVNYLKSRLNEEGFICHGLGDWGNPKNLLAKENVETCLLYADAVVLAEFAALLGKEDDRQELQIFADELKDNYNKKLLVKHPELGIYCYRMHADQENFTMTQACEAMPLYWGMVPDDKVEEVAEALRYIMVRDKTFISGEIGLPYIIQTMAKYGMNDLISQFILREEHPSYYAFVLQGETTLGEYWEENPRSHNHDMMGHIVEWYYNGIAGIQPLEPGFKQILIKPYLPETMSHFKCVYESVSGPITVEIEEINGCLDVKLDAPDSIEYEFDPVNLKDREYKVTRKTA